MNKNLIVGLIGAGLAVGATHALATTPSPAKTEYLQRRREWVDACDATKDKHLTNRSADRTRMQNYLDFALTGDTRQVKETGRAMLLAAEDMSAFPEYMKEQGCAEVFSAFLLTSAIHAVDDPSGPTITTWKDVILSNEKTKSLRHWYSVWHVMGEDKHGEVCSERDVKEFRKALKV